MASKDPICPLSHMLFVYDSSYTKEFMISVALLLFIYFFWWKQSMYKFSVLKLILALQIKWALKSLLNSAE